MSRRIDVRSLNITLGIATAALLASTAHGQAAEAPAEETQPVEPPVAADAEQPPDAQPPHAQPPPGPPPGPPPPGPPPPGPPPPPGYGTAPPGAYPPGTYPPGYPPPGYQQGYPPPYYYPPSDYNYGAPPPPPRETERNSTGLMVAGIVLTGVGAVAAVAGVIVATDAEEERYDGYYGYQTVDEDKRVAGIIVGLVGLGLIGAGIPMIIVGARKVPVKDAPEQPAEQQGRALPTLRLGLGAASVGWQL